MTKFLEFTGAGAGRKDFFYLMEYLVTWKVIKSANLADGRTGLDEQHTIDSRLEGRFLESLLSLAVSKNYTASSFLVLEIYGRGRSCIGEGRHDR